MRPKFLLSLLSFFLFSILHSQIKQNGSISGIVTDAGNNRALAGATITIGKVQRPTTSDPDGKFRIDGLPSGTYTITISYVGYEGKEVEGIEVKAGELTALTISLNLSKSTLKDVVVKTDAKKENLNGILNLRRNSAVVSDGISADMIKKSPDRNTSDVLKRISGTTIQENKFVVVRGMNDRYNEAMLNNALLPSSEPDRKTFAFDIFPADVVDNITIIKSASPDLPGSFSGGLIQINTKDVPDKNFFSVKGGLGYNSITTGKAYYHTPGSLTDWLGFDNSTRKLPDNFPGTLEYSSFGTEKKAALSSKVPNLWALLKENAPANTSLQLSGGFSTRFKNNKSYPLFGGIFGLVYSSTYNYNNLQRYDYTGLPSTPPDDSVYKYNDNSYTRSILESGLANFAFRVNQNNKFFFNNIYSINSSDQTVLRTGYSFDNQWNVQANSSFFSSNRIFNTQLGGDDYLPKSKLRIKWFGYYTNLYRNEPDYKRNTYVQINQGDPYFALITQTINSNYGSHYFANVKDKTKGANLDFSLPFKMFSNTQTFKAGASIYSNTRFREARSIAAKIASGSFNNKLLYYGQDSIFRQQNFNSTTGFIYDELADVRNNYDGSINNTTAYAMFDNKFTKQLRLIWGVRFEDYHQILNTFDANSQPLKIDTTYKDFLPSANLIYSVLPKANLRLSYNKSLARPQYRELAYQLFYDFLQNYTFYGNPDLTETHIDNYEVRWEHYFPNAQYYSVSFFYKKFKNPIEQYIPFPGSDSKTVSVINSPGATNYGVELEGRKNFDFISKKLENLVAYANVSFIKSKVEKNTLIGDTASRPLQGQSPYIYNFSLQYTDPKTNLALSALFNASGNRLFLVGGPSSDAIWEKPHSTLDLKLSKTFLKNGTVEFAVADILHKNDTQYIDVNGNQKFDNGVDRLYLNKTFGLRAGISLGYKF